MPPLSIAWILIALLLLALPRVFHRRRAPRPIGPLGTPTDDGYDWGGLARAARAVAERVRGPERPLALRADWDLALVGADGAVRERRRFKNLIVNVGLNQVKDRMFNPATAAAVFGFVAIGTGAVPETPVDTALGTEAARGATTYTAGGTGVCTVDRTFPAGTGTGAITEVGLFDAGAAGNMFNRKTFAAINKTASDALKASCTLTLVAV